MSEIELLRLQVAELQSGLAGSQAEVLRLQQELELQRRLYSGGPEALLLTDLRGQILQANQAACELTGYPLQELEGLNLRQLDLQLDEQEMAKLGVQAILEGQARFETLHHLKDGSLRPVEVKVRYLQLQGGRFAATLRDIQEQRRLEDALQEGINRYQAILNAAQDGFCVLDTQRNFVEVNRVFCQMTGYSPEELMGMNMPQLDLRPAPVIREKMEEVRTVGSARFETYLRRQAGEPLLVEISAHYVPINGGLIFSFSRDVSERSQALQALRESEEKFRTLAEQSMVGIAILQDYRLRYANPGLSRITGYTVEEMLGWAGEDFEQYIHPGDRPVALDKQRSLLDRGPDAFETYIYRVMCKDGQARWVEQFSRAFQFGQRPAVLVVFVDIDQQKRTEERLDHLLKEKQAILDAASVGIGLVRQRRMVWANAANDRIFGDFSSATRNQSTSIFHLSQEAFQQAGQEVYSQLKRGETYNKEMQVKRLDGQVIWASVSGRAIDPAHPDEGSIWVCQDITARKQSEFELRQALEEKEALLRELYHRVKNNMQVIIALLDMQASSKLDPEIRRLSQEMQNRIYSMALVHEKLYQSQNLADLDLGEYMQELAGELVDGYASAQPGQITLRCECQAVRAPIDIAIPCGLIVNELVTNSLRHAFPAGGPGEIRVSLDQAADGELLLQVADDGVGAAQDADLRSSMHMGLSIVSTLVQQIHGRHEFETVSGMKCRVQFRLGVAA